MAGRRNKMIVVVTFLLVIVILGTIVPVVYRNSIMPPTKSIRIGSFYLLYSSGPIKVRNFFSVSFHIPANSTFHCSANSINSSTFYLMNNSEYDYSGQHNWLPNESRFLFSAVLNNSSGTLSVPVTSGTWLAVFVDTNLNTSTVVNVNSMYWTFDSPAFVWRF